MLTLLCLGVAASPAYGQSVSDDPPGRVGRISLVEGQAVLSDASASEWTAQINWPITTGKTLRTMPQSRAEVRIGSLALRVDGDTLVDFTQIDDGAIRINVQWGGIAIALRNRELLPEIEVMTPRERLRFEDIGRYRVDVDRIESTTSVTTFSGAARVSTQAVQALVTSGQRSDFTGAPFYRVQQSAPQPDGFDQWTVALDRRDDLVRSTQYVSQELTGVETLDDHGRWQSVEGYGNVWFPAALSSDWAPYRHGRWVSVAPWGWTWLDEAPWGFATAHYGRWVNARGQWGWAPGQWTARPVYAPALVGWVGTPGTTVNIRAGDPIGWFPLAPGDVYAPAYLHSRRHWEGINRGYDGVRAPFPYRQDPRVVTWVPGRTLQEHAPVYRSITVPPPRWTSSAVVASPPPPPGIRLNIPPRDGRPDIERSLSDRRQPINPTGQGSVTRLPRDRPPFGRDFDGERQVRVGPPPQQQPVQPPQPVQLPQPMQPMQPIQPMQPPSVQPRNSGVNAMPPGASRPAPIAPVPSLPTTSSGFATPSMTVQPRIPGVNALPPGSSRPAPIAPIAPAVPSAPSPPQPPIQRGPAQNVGPQGNVNPGLPPPNVGVIRPGVPAAPQGGQNAVENAGQRGGFGSRGDRPERGGPPMNIR